MIFQTKTSIYKKIVFQIGTTYENLLQLEIVKQNWYFSWLNDARITYRPDLPKKYLFSKAFVKQLT